MNTGDVQTNENSEAFSLPLKNNDLKLMETDTEENASSELWSFAWTAALKVQKVYRSYRTRRRLADSAIVADELWWRAIDYARLNQTTTSFFNCSKPENAASRWNRVSSNASKIGKGLSNEASKALILAFQHWIEAIDPRHRYGHSLQLYYEAWRKGDNGQPFFYWLDVGDGRELDLTECPRSKLRQQCIKYLGPLEREHYEYVIAEGKILHKQSRECLDTVEGSKDAKWIFVLSTNKKLYAGKKKKGAFHHSSFLAGGATLSAGRLVAEDGVLKSISAYSGHYRPTHENLGSFLAYLKEHEVNLNGVQVQSTEDYENYGESKSVQAETVTNWHRNLSGILQLEIPNEMRKDQPSQPTDVVYTETLARELHPVVTGAQKRGARDSNSVLQHHLPLKSSNGPEGISKDRIY